MYGCSSKEESGDELCRSKHDCGECVCPVVIPSYYAEQKECGSVPAAGEVGHLRCQTSDFSTTKEVGDFVTGCRMMQITLCRVKKSLQGCTGLCGSVPLLRRAKRDTFRS